MPAIAYVPQNTTLEIELDAYAGYAGLVVANGGLEPNDHSPLFATKYGFKVHITLKDTEKLRARVKRGENGGLRDHGRCSAPFTGVRFRWWCRAQNIVFPRRADGLVVRNDIKRVNDLKGKVVAAAQFTESDFFIRYLAKEAGLNITMLPDLNAKPDPDAINLVFTATGDSAGDIFVKALESGSKAIAGCVTWAPKTTEIPEKSDGNVKARLLVSNKNLLIIDGHSRSQ